jgi:predicted metal-dependent peptidase
VQNKSGVAIPLVQTVYHGKSNHKERKVTKEKKKVKYEKGADLNANQILSSWYRRNNPLHRG